MKKLSTGWYHVVYKGVNEAAYFNGKCWAIVGVSTAMQSDQFDLIASRLEFEKTFIVSETGEVELAA